MRRRRWVWLCAIMTLTICGGIMAARAPRLDRAYVEKITARARERYQIPAAAVYVMNGEGVRFGAVEGVRVDGTAEAVAEDDYFHLGSCAKSVLAYMAGRMVEEGLIRWDTLFFDVLPEFYEDALDAYHDITLVDLLACRGGIQPYTSGAEAYPDLSGAEDKRAAFIRYLVGQDPAADRDETGAFAYAYSNAGYTLACAMLERAAGVPYEGLLDRYIRDELGLDVVIGWPIGVDEDQPWGHYLHDDRSLEPLGPDAGYSMNTMIAPAGDLSMRPGDFAEYVRLHLNGLRGSGGPLRQETVAYMDRGYDGFSLGAWNERTLGRECVYIDGSAGTFYARGLIIPEADFGIAVMINNGSEAAVDYISMALAKARFRWWWMFWV